MVYHDIPYGHFHGEMMNQGAKRFPRSIVRGDDFNFGIQYDSSRDKSMLYVSQKMEPWTRSLMHRIEHASESAAWPRPVTATHQLAMGKNAGTLGTTQ